LKQLRLLLITLIISILLLGCAPQETPPEDTYTPEESATGGAVVPQQNVNVKDIDITREDGQTQIRISMLSGSRKTGYPESKLVAMPGYEIAMLPQPQRLMITLQGISFWDYEPKETWALSDFVMGLFHEVPAQNDSLVIYVQLSREAEFSVEEADGELIVRLSPLGENTQDMYYCLAGAFFEHQEGTWPERIDMHPVLCSDLTNKLLISPPFESEEDAVAFLDEADRALGDTLQEIELYITQLNRASLPDFKVKAPEVPDEARSLAIHEGVYIDTPALLQSGRHLAISRADGRIAFSRSYKPEEPALEEDQYLLSDLLWIMDPNGRIQKVDVPEFFSITRAAFSMDGRYLAILDVSIENRVLYVYDFVTGEPINLGEEGFGSQTAAFAWSDEQNTLYAMTGFGDMQLTSCKFMDDGSYQIDAVEEMAGAEGVLHVSQTRLFFADKSPDSPGTIYEIGDVRREITTGVDFEVSPDGQKMLVLEAAAGEGERMLTGLKLSNIETGESTQIAVDAEIISFCFVQNGTKVCYTNAAEPDAEGDYLFGLYVYDVASGVSERVAFVRTGDFKKGMQPSEIYLIEHLGEMEQDNYATYVYDLSL